MKKFHFFLNEKFIVLFMMCFHSIINAQSNDCLEASKMEGQIDIVLALLREDTCQIGVFLTDTSNCSYVIGETQGNLLEYCIQNKKNQSAMFLVSNYSYFKNKSDEIKTFYKSVVSLNCSFLQKTYKSIHRPYFIESCGFLSRSIELRNLNYWYYMDKDSLLVSQGDTSTYCLLDIFLEEIGEKMDSLEYGGVEILIGARLNLLLVKKLIHFIRPNQKDSQGKTIFDYLLFDMEGQSVLNAPNNGDANQRVFIEYIDVLEFLLSLEKAAVYHRSEIGDIFIKCIKSNNIGVLKKICACENVKKIINELDIESSARNAAKNLELIQVIDEIFD